MNSEYKKGIFLALSAYILWGILPIYWQFVDAIGAFEILAFRIIFSAIFMIFILAVGQKQRNAFQRDMNQLLGKPIQLLAIVVAGYVITLNWGTFIWAVTNGHVLQTSLGYYINPLVSILLALIFLKERFNKFETQQIHFDLEHEIPYFQAPEKNRIRLDIDVLNKKQISNIINVIFNNQSKTKCTFLSEYLYPVKFREKTRIGRFFNITNWYEEIHSTDEKYVIATIKNIKNKDLIDYSLYIKKGLVEPFIVFYNQENIFYISNAVIDIISVSKDTLDYIKSEFNDHCASPY